LDMDKRDKAYIKELTHGTVRQKLLLDRMFESAVKKEMGNVSKKMQPLIRMSVYQLMFMKDKEYAVCDAAVSIAKQISPKEEKFVNWALREFLRNRKSIVVPDGMDKASISTRYSFNLHMTEYLLKENGVNHAIELMEFYNTPPDLYAFGIDTGEYRQISSISEMTDREYIMDPAYVNMFMFLRGYEVKTVLDCCAAPGGKSFLIKSFDKDAEILALDSSQEGLSRMKENIDRLKLKNIDLVNADFLQTNISKVFDLVLVDAPCTATGTIRKNPDVKYNYRKKLPELVQIQNSMLEKADEYVKDGCFLLYTTCSILHMENYEIINEFLARHREYKIYNQYFSFGLPFNGSYGALLKKNGG